MAVKNAMPWMVLGIRGPGGSRTDSAVAVTIASPSGTGLKYSLVTVPISDLTTFMPAVDAGILASGAAAAER
jgi:hypothetical protein